MVSAVRRQCHYFLKMQSRESLARFGRPTYPFLAYDHDYRFFLIRNGGGNDMEDVDPAQLHKCSFCDYWCICDLDAMVKDEESLIRFSNRQCGDLFICTRCIWDTWTQCGWCGWWGICDASDPDFDEEDAVVRTNAAGTDLCCWCRQLGLPSPPERPNNRDRCNNWLVQMRLFRLPEDVLRRVACFIACNTI